MYPQCQSGSARGTPGGTPGGSLGGTPWGTPWGTPRGPYPKGRNGPPCNTTKFSKKKKAYNSFIRSLEKFDLALSDGKKAVERSPEWHKGHYRKGCAYLQLGSPVEALWAFSTACKLSDPPSAELLNALNHAKQLVGADRPEEDTPQPQNDTPLGGMRAELEAAMAGLQDCEAYRDMMGLAEDEEEGEDEDDDYSPQGPRFCGAFGRGMVGHAEEDDEEEEEIIPDPPRRAPRHDWFDCRLCENRTRDYAETTCCAQPLCGTCNTRATRGVCPYRCA